MKKLFIILFVLFFSVNLFAQNQGRGEMEKLSLIVSTGYLPKSSYNALAPSITINNLLFERIGFYGSLQFGLDSDYFSNILGITGTIHENVYLFAGMDLFSKRGFVNKQFNNRKEFGVGFIPHPNIAIEGGYSFTAGFIFGAGLRIPLTWVSGGNQYF